MKKILTICSVSLLFLLFILSCSFNSSQTPENYSYEHNGGVWSSMDYKIEQKTIDSCEYIIIFGDKGRNIIHKANCKNSFHTTK